jgi:DNA primase
MPRFTPDFLDELKARLRPSDIIGRRVKLKKQGNEWVALSPFTKEKTPSFYVNDQKGFYHCFSSGRHGDIIKFLQETEKLSFAEAVTLLAEEAGLPLPEERPGERAAEEERKGLIEACEAAATFYAASLRRVIGRQASDYLKGRGVTDDQIDAFGIGYAPGERAALKDYLINKGFREETLIEAGLLIKPEDGGESYDRFRNRVMFPIVGLRRGVIAFGGRALEKDTRAKYLNSPETPLFHKGALLYNYLAARTAASETGSPLIVCEGYIDVVALWGAGFRTAVAPLGTALTEEQLALLWRASDEPLLCFDGDKAGLGAAYRAVDRALPLLKPGKSLSFVFLPDGLDPDDLIRARGPEAMRTAIAAAEPLAAVLWRKETEGRPLDTPERRAALRAHLRALVAGIADKDVRNAYGDDFAGRLQAMTTRPAATPRAGGERRAEQRQFQPGRNPFRAAPPPMPTAALKRMGAPSAWRREATLLLALIHHPELVEAEEASVLGLRLGDPGLSALLAAIIDARLNEGALDSEGLRSHLQRTPQAETMQRILHDEALNRQTFLRPGAEMDEVLWGWSDALRHHRLATEAKPEVAELASQAFQDGDDAWKAAVTAREEIRNSGADAERFDDEGEVGGDDFARRLEAMRASVRARRGEP